MKALRAFLLALPFAAPVAVSAQTTILFNNFLPEADVTNRNVVQPWLKSIEDATEGRVVIEQPVASLAPPPELLNTVQQGMADAGFIMVGFLENSNPLLQLPLLPGINTNAEDSSIAMWRTYREHLAAGDKLDGVQVLGFVTVTPGHLYTMGDEPIETIADMKNIKIWGLPGVASQALSLLGGVVTPGPAVRMYEVISGGVVDAFCCINYPALESFNVTQYMKSATELPGGIFAPTFVFFIGDEIWNAISPEDRQAILDVSGETMGRLAAGVDREYAEARQRFIESGGRIVEASDEFAAAARAAWAPLREKWIANADAAGADGHAAMAYMAEQQELLGKERSPSE